MARDLSTPEGVCAAIRVLWKERRGGPLPWYTIHKVDPELMAAAERDFKIWGKAVEAAGFDILITRTKSIG